MRTVRLLMSLGLLALPVSCQTLSGNDLYTGGLRTSGPGSNINPAEPWLVNGGGR